MFGNVHCPIFVEIRSQSANADLLRAKIYRCYIYKLYVPCLELFTEVGEELYPELPVVHVVEPHLPLDLVRDRVPAGVPITPLSPPLVLVSPRVTNPLKEY